MQVTATNWTMVSQRRQHHYRHHHHRSLCSLVSTAAFLVSASVVVSAVGQVSSLSQSPTTGILMCAVGGEATGRDRTTAWKLRDAAVDIGMLLASACEQLESSAKTTSRFFTYAFSGDESNDHRPQLSADSVGDILRPSVKFDSRWIFLVRNFIIAGKQMNYDSYLWLLYKVGSLQFIAWTWTVWNRR